jgi:hypothetical protein
MNKLLVGVVTILLASACTAPLRSAEFFEMSGNRLYAELDSNARAVGLRQLRSSGEDELRLWALEPMGGGVTGLIVRPGGVLRCKTSYKYQKNEIAVMTGSCAYYRGASASRAALKMLADLEELNESSISCGVLDGWSVDIEGVHDGSRFAFDADNPDSCDDSVSGLVMRVYATLK